MCSFKYPARLGRAHLSLLPRMVRVGTCIFKSSDLESVFLTAENNETVKLVDPLINKRAEEAVMIEHMKSYDPCPDSKRSPQYALGLKPVQIH